MTSSDTLDDVTPPAPPPDWRRLRRAHDGRVGAGVAAGLGQYFGLDPVLFRVLFATSAFFGGAGIIAYLLAWAAIPDEGTERAPIDRWIEELRRRRVPLWMVAGGIGLLIWLVAFSWWAPGRFLPAVGAVVLVLFLVARRNQRDPRWRGFQPPPEAAATPTVDLRKHPAEPTESAATEEPPVGPPPPGPVPAWVAPERSWFDDARAASRARRRRAQPVRIATLIVLLATLGALALVDALTGIPLRTYFWAGLAIVVVGLLVGLALRRAPIALAVLAVPLALGTVAFSSTSASFSDGSGERHWKPTGAQDYRLAFGRSVLDLTKLNTTSARHIDVTMAAGQTVIIVPKAMNATVHADVRFGNVEVDGNSLESDRGMSVSQTVHPRAGATGAPVTVDVQLAEGNISVDRR